MVVAILGVLAAVGIVSYNGFMESAKIKTHKTNEKTVADFIKLIFLRCAIEGDHVQIDGYVSPANSGKGIDCNYNDSHGAIYEMNGYFAQYFDGVIENAFNSNEGAFIAASGVLGNTPEKYSKYSQHDGKFILTFGNGAKGECNSNIKNETVTSKNCLKIVSRLPEYPDGRQDIDLFMHHW